MAQSYTLQKLIIEADVLGLIKLRKKAGYCKHVKVTEPFSFDDPLCPIGVPLFKFESRYNIKTDNYPIRVDLDDMIENYIPVIYGKEDISEYYHIYHVDKYDDYGRKIVDRTIGKREVC